MIGSNSASQLGVNAIDQEWKMIVARHLLNQPA
jgi:hypothetical protein